MSWDIKLCAEPACLEGSEKFRNFAPRSPIIFQHFTQSLQSDQPLINFGQVVTSRVSQRKITTGPVFILLLQSVKALCLLFLFFFFFLMRKYLNLSSNRLGSWKLRCLLSTWSFVIRHDSQSVYLTLLRTVLIVFNLRTENNFWHTTASRPCREAWCITENLRTYHSTFLTLQNRVDLFTHTFTSLLMFCY